MVRATDQPATITIRTISWEKDRWQSVPYTLNPLPSERPVILCMTVSPMVEHGDGSRAPAVILWALDSGRRTAAMIPDGDGDDSVLQFSPDGQRVASGASNGDLDFGTWRPARNRRSSPAMGTPSTVSRFHPMAPSWQRRAWAERVKL